MQPLQLPHSKILFLFSGLNWIRSLGGIMVDGQGGGEDAQITSVWLEGEYWSAIRSTQSDPEGYSSVNNVSVWQGASPLNHRWAIHTLGLNLYVCVWVWMGGGAQQAPSTDWAPPPSKHCKHGEASTYSCGFVSEKTKRSSTLNSSVRSWAVRE